MKLDISLFAGLTCRNEALPCFGKQEFKLNAPPGITVGALHQLLGIGAARVVTVVNGVIEKKEHVLRPNDRVGMFPPIAGGASCCSSLAGGRYLEGWGEGKPADRRK